MLSFRTRALAELTLACLEYALIREPKDSEIFGDVDILVRDINKADKILSDLGYLKFSQSKNNAKYLKFDLQTSLWVHLDVQTRIKFGLIWSPDKHTTLLLSTIWKNNYGVQRLDRGHEIIITILHAAIAKGKFDSEYKNRIFKANLEKLYGYEKFYDFLPGTLRKHLEIVIEMRNGALQENEVVKIIQKSFGVAYQSKGKIIQRAIRRLRSIFPINKGIVFLGPDGAGKSALTIPLSHLQWPSSCRQFMGPSSPSEMRFVLYKLTQLLSKIRYKYSRSHPIGLFARIFWNIICYIDFWERLLRHIWFWGSNGIVFFDRFACDMYFRNPSFFNELLFIKYFPKPKFVFLCMGDAEEIHRRKKELSIAEIENTIELYRSKFSQYNIPYAEVNTTSNTMDQCVCQVVRHLINNQWFQCSK